MSTCGEKYYISEIFIHILFFYHVSKVLNNLDKRDTYRSKSFILAYVQQCMAISPTLQLVYQLKITANANEWMF